jgi:hypothetical protein
VKPYECPLCNLEFEGENCRSACGMSKGCTMVKCPRCSYEFVTDGTLASFFRRLMTRRKDHAANSR